MDKKSFVLDTSIFVNPAAAHVYGASPTEAFKRFLELAAGAKGLNFYMPPSIVRELMFFCEAEKISAKALNVIHQKAPKKNELKVPGMFIYQLVENMRDRVDRGLRLSERHVREAIEMEPPVKGERGDAKKPRPDAEVIQRLRETYRRIMREGLLDSKADVDLLLLAYELEAIVVSADQGLLDWAENLGLSVSSPEQFHARLTASLTPN